MVRGAGVRNTTAVALAVAGALLVGTVARWDAVGAEAPADGLFRVATWGVELFAGPRAADGTLATGGSAPALIALALGLAVILGLAVGRGLRSRVAGLAAALPALLLPLVADFVASRPPATAGAYLDLEDLARGLGLALLLCAAWPFLAPAGRGAGAGPVEPGGEERARRASIAVAVLAALVLPAMLATSALDGEPLTNDGVSYRFQAEQFAAGRAFAPAGEQADFFPARQVAREGERIFSKYPPGHSALLALGSWLGLGPWLPRLLGALTVALTAWWARRLGAPRPDLAAWLLALSPAFLGVEALWLSHGTSLPACLAFACLATVARDGLAGSRREVGSDGEARTGDEPPSRGVSRTALAAALGAGFALSLAFAARPLTALAFAAPFLVELLLSRPRGAFAVVGATLAGGLPLGLGFLAVNAAQTGDAFLTAYSHYATNVSPNDRWGLANLSGAGERTAYNAARAAVWFHGFALSLVGLCLGAVGARAPRRAALLWTPVLTLLAAYGLHRFHGIPWVGPLYLVEALPGAAILSATALAGLGVAQQRVVLGTATLGAALLLGAHFQLAAEQAFERSAPRRAAERAGLESGLVFVRLTGPQDVKRYPLPPPSVLDARTGLLFARDLGSRNAELARAAEVQEAWVFVPGTAVLLPWRDGE